MKYSYIVLAFLLLGCNQNKEKVELQVADKLTVKETSKKGEVTDMKLGSPQLIIKDSSKYSKEFLEYLKSEKFGSRIELFDNDIVIDGDTSIFSDNLKLSRTYNFYADDNDKTFILKVKKRNLTTIDFEFNSIESGQAQYSKKGEANMLSAFFLGSETNEDELDGMLYPVDQYYMKNDSEIISIRLDMNHDSNGKIRATFSVSNPKGENIFNFYKTLRTK